MIMIIIILFFSKTFLLLVCLCLDFFFSFFWVKTKKMKMKTKMKMTMSPSHIPKKKKSNHHKCLTTINDGSTTIYEYRCKKRKKESFSSLHSMFLSLFQKFSSTFSRQDFFCIKCNSVATTT